MECGGDHVYSGDHRDKLTETNVPDAALSQTFSRTLQMLVFSPCLRATEVEEVVLSYLLASDHHVEASKTYPYKIPYVEHSVPMFERNIRRYKKERCERNS